MGDPKRLRKAYSTPIHPWSSDAIAAEKVIKRDYGLKNKKEIFRANSFLKKYKDLAKKFIADTSAQGQREKELVMSKLFRLGLLKEGSSLDDVLGLNVENVLERRLQSVLVRKGLARSMKQARQFITHRHVLIGEREITAPGYLVSLEEEALVIFKVGSALSDEKHPERGGPEEKEQPSAPVKDNNTPVEKVEDAPEQAEEKTAEANKQDKADEPAPAAEEAKAQ